MTGMEGTNTKRAKMGGTGMESRESGASAREMPGKEGGGVPYRHAEPANAMDVIDRPYLSGPKFCT